MASTETVTGDTIDLQEAITANSSSSATTTTTTNNPLVSRLHEILNTCSELIQADADQDPKIAFSPLVEFLNHIHETESEETAVADVLNEILLYMSSPSFDQIVMDALAFELQESVSKLAGVSEQCREIVDCIIDCLVLNCSPRNMLTVLCEALDSLIGMVKQPAYFCPILGGLSKVFLRIQRRQFEQIKVAIPVIVSVLKGVSFELDDDDKDSFKDLMDRGISLATSIQEVCEKLEGRRKEQVRAVLGLFVLQIMSLVSSRLVDKNFSCIQVVSQLSQFLLFCNMSYLDLITGNAVETLTNIILEENDVEDSDDFIGCFSFVKHGSYLAVIWGHISDEVVKAAKEDLSVVKDNLQNSQSMRWQAVGMLTYILSSFDLPWLLKKHAVDFVLYIMDGNISHTCNNSDADCSAYVLSLFSAIQAMQNVIIHASDAVFRRNCFAALKKVLADIPPHQRFDILKASISSNDHPSMIALLLGLVKDEMFMDNCQKAPKNNDAAKLVDRKIFPLSPFWSKDVLELVEFVLKPPKGGPPSLPEQSDAVLSALNLYRFILITESTGKTNYTGVLSEDILQKAYTEWLRPLRTLLAGIAEENKKESDEFTDDIICGLNPVEFVLHRCIELVDEKLHCA